MQDVRYGVSVAPLRPVPGGPVLETGPRSHQAAVAALSEEPAVKLRHVDPVYPPSARGIPGDKQVTLELHVRRNGRVGRVNVKEVSMPAVGLSDAAVDAARQWRYRPARRHGKAVESRVTVTMVFD